MGVALRVRGTVGIALSFTELECARIDDHHVENGSERILLHVQCQRGELGGLVAARHCEIDRAGLLRLFGGRLHGELKDVVLDAGGAPVGV